MLDVALMIWGLGVYVLAPTLLGALSALAFWLRRNMLLGNAIGSTVIAVVMIFHILQFLANTFNASSTILDLNDAWLPLGALVITGWVDVLLLFVVGGIVESRVKHRMISPEDF
ncbi:MAG: hypothetical protein ACK4WM_00105 [Thermoflexales bacterium]